MKATFENTVNILVKAYLNDTLEHGNCYACAVGNLVAHNLGYQYTNCMDRPSKRLALIQNSGRYCGETVGAAWYESNDDDRRIKEIVATGYTFDQVMRIERAFEQSPRGGSDDQWMFNGLMAVVTVLAEIHGVSLEERESAKLLFVK